MSMHISLSQGLANFFEKDQTVNVVCFAGSMVSETTTQAYNCKSRHRQYINKWVHLAPIKITSTKSGIDLWAVRPVFMPQSRHIYR